MFYRDQVSIYQTMIIHHYLPWLRFHLSHHDTPLIISFHLPNHVIPWFTKIDFPSTRTCYTMVYHDRVSIHQIMTHWCKNIFFMVAEWFPTQGAANQFEMWSEESLFLLVLYKGMKTKLCLRRGLQKTSINGLPVVAPLKRLHPTCCYIWLHGIIMLILN